MPYRFACLVLLSAAAVCAQNPAPMEASEKLEFAARKLISPVPFFTAGMSAGISQANNSHPELGQGMEGFGNRYARSLANSASGRMFIRGVFPALLKEDPRYFRMGPEGGSTGKRLRYALSRVFVTRTDSGHSRFNFSEVLGGAASTGLSNAYYQDRTWGRNGQHFGMRLTATAATTLMREFWPDIRRKLKK